MNCYLLLRNNKEMGPFSLEDLVTHGLKPYDLIWIQGRSAAWRYPSEIEELKAHAPVLEEQPYDRFYKKSTDSTPATEKKEEAIIQATVSASKSGTKQTQDASHTPVYISRPSGNNNAASTQLKTIKEEEVKKEQAAQHLAKPENEQWAHPSTRSNEKATQVLSSEQHKSIDPIDTPSLERRYSKPLDEIKEMYVQTLHDRKQRMARKNDWQRRVKQVAPFALILIAGIAIGLLINKKPAADNGPASDLATVDPGHDNAVINTATREITPITSPEEDLQPDQGQNDDINAAKSAYEGAYTDSVARSLAYQGRTQNSGERKLIKATDGTEVDLQPTRRSAPTEPAPDYNGTEKSIVSDPGGERNRRVRDDGQSGAGTTNSGDVQSLNDLLKKVSVSSNDYVRGAFGGIKNLEITVRNNTRYSLDKVYVELQYMKPSEQALKTEVIEFSSVAPRGTSTLKIPDSQRGIRVQVKIKRISSQQLTDALAGL